MMLRYFVYIEYVITTIHSYGICMFDNVFLKSLDFLLSPLNGGRYPYVMIVVGGQVFIICIGVTEWEIQI